MVTAVLLASIWWAAQLEEAIFSLKEHIFSPRKAMESYWSLDQKYSWDSLSFYLRSSINYLSSLFLFAFIFTFILFLKSKVRYKGIYISWLIFPFLFFSLVFTVKQPRLVMPTLPAIALITAWGIYQIRIKILRYLALFTIIIFGLTQFCSLSYNKMIKKVVFLGPLKLFGWSEYTMYSGPCKKDLKSINAIMQIIKKHSNLDRPIKICSIVTCQGHDPSKLELVYLFSLKDRHLEVLDSVEMYRYLFKDFNSMNFILFRTPRLLSPWPRGEKLRNLLKEAHSSKRINQLQTTDFKWEKLLNAIENARPDFQLIGKVPTKGRCIYYVYRRKPDRK